MQIEKEKGFPLGTVTQNTEKIEPENNIIETLIIRDEPVSVVSMAGFEFEFKLNEHGHKVCLVPNKGVRMQMLETGNFREYVPPVVEEESESQLFLKSWHKISGDKFTEMVLENPDRFAEHGEEILEIAKKKWAKRNGNEPWPGGSSPPQTEAIICEGTPTN